MPKTINSIKDLDYKIFMFYWKHMTPSERCECLLDRFNHKCEFRDFELVAFYFKEKNIWVAIDNRDGQCWVEDFKTKRAARKWCKYGTR